ncbi:hypothetical protein BG005_006083 [Podila minutissima]|nr:hypothetical protein BG005_006083 [Podila minutissima]
MVDPYLTGPNTQDGNPPAEESRLPPPMINVDSYAAVPSPDGDEGNNAMPADDESDIHGIAAVSSPDHPETVKPVKAAPKTVKPLEAAPETGEDGDNNELSAVTEPEVAALPKAGPSAFTPTPPPEIASPSTADPADYDEWHDPEEVDDDDGEDYDDDEDYDDNEARAMTMTRTTMRSSGFQWE